MSRPGDDVFPKHLTIFTPVKIMVRTYLLLLSICLLLTSCGDDTPVGVFSEKGKLRIYLQWPQSNKSHVWLETARLSIVGEGMAETILKDFKHLHYRPDDYLDFELSQGYKSVQIELKDKKGQLMATQSTDVNILPGRSEQVRFKIRAVTEAELKKMEEEKKKKAAELAKQEDTRPFYLKAYHYAKRTFLKWVKPLYGN